MRPVGLKTYVNKHISPRLDMPTVSAMGSYMRIGAACCARRAARVATRTNCAVATAAASLLVL
eukprot:6181680-Pleurochrysis_carterae.AAC.1